ncbi:unnamed protein product [Soboliphyme baturini]|uniref:HSF_DOMAIN domain-containing protein n=1 Tax=Soboliphyme baturini TaxID=241478 RepID=A0A183J4F3_9BILA|nr:unnamed protein product [Soboliphyme baturini]
MVEPPLPSFINKLWTMVNSKKRECFIKWSEDGHSFYVTDTRKFSREVLPHFFKHQNMLSFIRQLNHYGFHKVTTTESGSLKNIDQDLMQYEHPYFVRGRFELLFLIRRKSAASRSSTSGEVRGGLRGLTIEEMRIDLQQMKDKLALTESELARVSGMNSRLWQELMELRQMHMKQNKLLTMIIQFLVSVVQPEKKSGKRSLLSTSFSPGMITSFGGKDDGKKLRLMNDISPGSVPPFKDQELNDQWSPQGPLIADVTEESDLTVRNGPHPPFKPDEAENAIGYTCNFNCVQSHNTLQNVTPGLNTQNKSEIDDINQQAMLSGDMISYVGSASPLKERLSGVARLGENCTYEFLGPEESRPKVGVRDIQLFLDSMEGNYKTIAGNGAPSFDVDKDCKSLYSLQCLSPSLVGGGGNGDFDMREFLAPLGNDSSEGDNNVLNDIFLSHSGFMSPGIALSPDVGTELSLYAPLKVPACDASSNEQQDSSSDKMLSGVLESDIGPETVAVGPSSPVSVLNPPTSGVTLDDPQFDIFPEVGLKHDYRLLNSTILKLFDDDSSDTDVVDFPTKHKQT